jgi:hypothetical protein
MISNEGRADIAQVEKNGECLALEEKKNSTSNARKSTVQGRSPRRTPRPHWKAAAGERICKRPVRGEKSFFRLWLGPTQARAAKLAPREDEEK